mmetsp:Transcript_673/g.2624  ORF Transcript_673/g.2624 Transcript_673/m.2624 type:complete len:351 (+) Transcript_673:1302-2354(+)
MAECSVLHARLRMLTLSVAGAPLLTSNKGTANVSTGSQVTRRYMARTINAMDHPRVAHDASVKRSSRQMLFSSSSLSFSSLVGAIARSASRSASPERAPGASFACAEARMASARLLRDGDGAGDSAGDGTDVSIDDASARRTMLRISSGSSLDSASIARLARNALRRLAIFALCHESVGQLMDNVSLASKSSALSAPIRVATLSKNITTPQSGAASIVRTGLLGTCLASRSAAQRYRACHNANRASSSMFPRAPLNTRRNEPRHGGCFNSNFTLSSAVAAVAWACSVGQNTRAVADIVVVANAALSDRTAIAESSMPNLGAASVVFTATRVNATNAHARLTRVMTSGKAI